MPRQRNPKRDEAYQMWKDSGGKMKLVDIAHKLDMHDSQLRKWKAEDKWTLDGESVPKRTESKRNDPKKEKRKRSDPIDKVPDVAHLIENDEDILDEFGLTGKQRLFVHYYAVSPNATKAAIKAGYNKTSAYQVGYELLKKHEINSAIRTIRKQQEEEINVTAGMIINQLWKIASADINDFIQYRDSPPVRVVDPETGDMTLQSIRSVEVRPSDEVDGTLISEIRQTRDGIAFKRYDALDALKTLAKIKGMLTDNVNVNHSGEVRQVNEQHYHVIQEVIEKSENAPELVREIFGRNNRIPQRTE